ncbi:lytic murein transglycosylase [Ruixingdingia sedimenti]|uniref:Lytic murein transglycosylase n=1 Tax=Ruixingdingia sedimenti TaxID=3073604 RepID=A0ABU1FDS5_9RHOB|nr:lytic murein transglycosylase [Xinfangfangia sp. LG-4]MDR5655015.1 lytic murein transglycosylase [Xinfangfangia sp. LG-4]
MRQWIMLTGLSAAMLPVGCGFAGPTVESSPRPMPRAQVTPASLPAAPNPGFDRWVQGFRPRALAQGISPATFDRALAIAWYDPEIIARDRRQAEFTKTIWEYLDSAVSDTRIANGQKALAEHGRVLTQIEARYGVDKEVVAAVWGLESAYGAHRGTTLIIPALATLAYDGRRGAFFEEQLIAALKILQAGDTDPRHMTGSWAGAMGHTQFIPTSYLAYAVDFTGDGRRDIWSDNPADALASTAAYLARHGWTKGQPWGVEVTLPRGFNYALAGKKTKKSVADWQALGVRTAAGGRLPDHGAASILLPAGARGVALMIFGNFSVIGRYNNADSYIIGVGHLSDRLKGGGAFRTPWPRGDRALVAEERKELQERLTRAGYDTGGADGKIGPNTLAAIARYQAAAGLVPDGYPSLDLLNRLR